MTLAVNANNPTASVLVHRIPAFNDNYIWLLQERSSNLAYVVDPGTAEPVLGYLTQQQLTLAGILLTHHHNDHIGGVHDLLASAKCSVFGPDTQRFAELVTVPVTEGSEITLFEKFKTRVMTLPGHTTDHICYYLEPAGQAPLLFCGDTLFAGGCGRLFEGTPAQMLSSLQKLAALNDATEVYCAHEYTLANLRFAMAAEPSNEMLKLRLAEVEALRANDSPTVPSTIEVEKLTNPFLRSDQEPLARSISQHAGKPLEQSVEVFAATRQWKDNF